ncbi:MAG TPA: hypothetical protein VLE48_09365 [Terriglobales bacterium]|nr:hypothetical protein [Terriglobales bacterium]
MPKPDGPEVATTPPLTRLEEPYLSQLAAAAYRRQAAEAEERAAELQLLIARKNREEAAARCQEMVARLRQDLGLDLSLHRIHLDSGELLPAQAA